MNQIYKLELEKRENVVGKVCPITEAGREYGGCRWPLTTAAQPFLSHHGWKSHQAPVSAGRCFPPNGHL